MTLLLMEGFGHCETGAVSAAGTQGEDLHLNWNHWAGTNLSIEAVSTTYGIKKALVGSATSSLRCFHTLATTPSAIAMGCRVYRETTDMCSLLGWGAVGGMFVNTSGYFGWTYNSQWRMTADILLGSTPIPEDEWTYLEVYIEPATGSTGVCRLYVNGTLDTEWTNQQTAYAMHETTVVRTNTYVSPYSYWGPGWKITDIYVDDAENHGQVECFYQPADTAGSAAGFTPSAGSNHQNVDDGDGNDGDTTYNDSTAPGTKDQIAHSITHLLGPKGIQPVALVRSFSGEQTGVQLGILSDGTEDLDGTNSVPLDQWTWAKGDIHETDPATATEWTASGADDAETVIKHVAVA